MNDAVTWTLRKVDQKYLENFEIWCWGRMEKISWTNRVRSYKVLRNREMNIPQTPKRRKANCVGPIWRRNCLIKHVIVGKIKVSYKWWKHEEQV